MMFGLEDRAIETIRTVFKKFDNIREVRIFGSRALDTFRPNSDIDVALMGDDVKEVRGLVAAALDELPLPYKFDVVCFDEIENMDLKDHINRIGKVFYSR